MKRSLSLLIALAVAVGVLGAVPASAAPGDIIVYECSGDICVINADGTDEANLTNSPESEQYDPIWSPDGARIAFASNAASAGNPDANFEIFVMDASGSNVVQQTFTVQGPFDFVQSFAPSWGPDGAEIAFEGWRGSNAEILKVPSDGSGNEILLTDPTDFASKFQPNWSADGTKILFTWDLGQQDIFVINPDGSNPINLTPDTQDSSQRDPVWSPDGTRFAFTDTRFWNQPTFNTEIFIRNADGGGEVQVTDHEDIDDTPTWSPDGSEIIFSSTRGGIYEIWTIAAPPAPAPLALLAEEPVTKIATSGGAADPDSDAGSAPPSSFALTINLAGTGSGKVTSNPTGINCGVDCTETYTAGTIVTLSARAGRGSTFAGWSGPCTGTGACTVSMSAAQAVTATFSAGGGGGGTFTLSVAKIGTASGSVTSSPSGIRCGSDCTEAYASNTVVTLSARPARGATFAGWSGACSGTSTCVVTMDAAKSVSATFN